MRSVPAITADSIAGRHTTDELTHLAATIECGIRHLRHGFYCKWFATARTAPPVAVKWHRSVTWLQQRSGSAACALPFGQIVDGCSETSLTHRA